MLALQGKIGKRKFSKEERRWIDTVNKFILCKYFGWTAEDIAKSPNQMIYDFNELISIKTGLEAQPSKPKK